MVVDRLSKYGHFIPLKHPFTAKSMVETFTRKIVRLHGIPKSMVNDRDPLFPSSFWTEIFRLQDTHLKFSSTYHPQTDAQSEVLNRTIESYLQCFHRNNPSHGCS